MKSPLLVKLTALGAVMGVLLLALGAVNGIVEGRQEHQQSAERAIVHSLAGDQTFVGPMIRRQCEETWTRQDGTEPGNRKVPERRTFVQTLWPQRLSVSSRTAIQPRYRGLFKVNGYLADAELTADWSSLAPPPSDGNTEGSHTVCQPPTMALVVGDVRGIRSASVAINQVDREVRSGSAASEAGGLHADMPETPTAGAPVHAVIHLALAGTGSLAWAPVGDESSVHLVSDWPHPSFVGQFLPVSREVTAKGFEARWQVSSLASNAQRQYEISGRVCKLAEVRDDEGAPADRATCADGFGVRFIDPVNPYLLSGRATKYGFLFIFLTFVGVGLVEISKRLQVHPMQYLLVGSALTVFFLLLIGLSEHIGFGPAYTCAAAACSGLLGFYGAHLLKGRRPGLLFGAGVGLLYGALFVLLQQEQTALLLGSVLLFLTIGAVMIVTRRMDWYTPDQPDPAPALPSALSSPHPAPPGAPCGPGEA